MDKYVLITGANGGIGRALALEFAVLKYNLVLVGTKQDQLDSLRDELANEYPINITTIVEDFTSETAIKNIIEIVNNLDLDVEIVCNNAGFAGYGEFVDGDLKRDVNMVKVNCIAPLELCYHFGKVFKEKGKGLIMNTASLAGFMPGPLMATYFASKAFLLSFSQSLYNELKPYNVHVMALCPGPVNTNLWANGKADNTKLLKNVEKVTPAKIAKIAVRALLRKKMIEVPFAKNKFLAFLTRLFPRKLVIKASRSLQAKNKR